MNRPLRTRILPKPVFTNVNDTVPMPRVAPVLSLRIRPRFRVIREERGMRLKQLEALTGIAASILSQIERGERFPRPKDLEGLTVAYGEQRHWYEVVLEEVPA